MSTLKWALRALALLALIAASPANAADTWHQNYLKTVYPLANGNFVLTFVTSPASCTNASTPKYFHVTVGANSVTSDGARGMLSAALMALASGKRVAVSFDANSSSCDVNRMYVSD